MIKLDKLDKLDKLGNKYDKNVCGGSLAEAS